MVFNEADLYPDQLRLKVFAKENLTCWVEVTPYRLWQTPLLSVYSILHVIVTYTLYQVMYKLILLRILAR